MKTGRWRVGLHRATRAVLFSLVLLALVVPAADAAATRLWLKRYNGPASEVDSAAALAIDDEGNVYVAGRSHGGSSDEDYLVIKYGGANGGVKWMKRYDGTASDWDGARAIVVDGDGNVYVTGRSFGSSSDGDVVTIKYNSSGGQQWVKRYSSPGSKDDGGMDIALDSNGDVIVTGFRTGTGNQYDFVTIKYAPDGTRKWVKQYDGPDGGSDIARAIAVDSNNNVYVTGPSKGDGTNFDYCLVKYSAGGKELWVGRWDSSYSMSDGSMDVAVDSYNFPYITGYSYRNASNCDIVTVRFSRAGKVMWVRRYNGSANGPDVGYAIDAWGTGIFVAGSSVTTRGDADIAMLRYKRNGVQKWVKRWGYEAGQDDVPNDIEVENKRVYVTGFSTRSSTSGDLVVLARGGGGGNKWRDRYNGPGNGFDQGNAVGVCPTSGDVYVVGGSGGTGSGSDFVTIKYAP
jgi:uncharacterized delta-60 repeat protein